MEEPRTKAVREAQAVAKVVGGAGLRALWTVVRVLLLFIAVSALAFRFMVQPRLDAVHDAMQRASDEAARTKPVASATATPEKYLYHYELTAEQKQKMTDAWPRQQLSKIYVVSADESAMLDRLDPAAHDQKVQEAKTVAKDLSQVFWDSSIDASLVDETKPMRYRNRGVTLVLNAPEDGSFAPRLPEVDLLLAVLRAADIPANCCQRDPSVPEGSVGIVIGSK